MVIFHSYVKLPEGILYHFCETDALKEHDLRVCGTMMFMYITCMFYPLVNIQKAIENGH